MQLGYVFGRLKNSINFWFLRKFMPHTPPDPETAEIMENHDLDEGDAEEVLEVMAETGLDEDEAVELWEMGV